MVVTGGVATFGNSVELTISIKGGNSYKKNYHDVVNTAINKFNIFSSTLNKMFTTELSETDKQFFVNQTKRLFQRAHVEFLTGELPFHQIYNMWLLDGYIKMLLETNDIKLIAQLLNLDLILYSVEESKQIDNNPAAIDFDAPKNLKMTKLPNAETNKIKKLEHKDDLTQYIYDVNDNLQLLMQLINLNKDSLAKVYEEINNTALSAINN